MKIPYEIRHGHPRYRKATLHLARQERKRREAIQRNAAWSALSVDQKIEILKQRPGACSKQLAKLLAAQEQAA